MGNIEMQFSFVDLSVHSVTKDYSSEDDGYDTLLLAVSIFVIIFCGFVLRFC